MTLYKRHPKTKAFVSDPTADGWTDGADFYFRFQFQRKVYWKCLFTSNKQAALKAAAQIKRNVIAATLAGNSEAVALALGKVPKPEPKASTVDQLETAYTAAALEAQGPSKTANIHALRRLLRAHLGSDAQRLDVLNRAFVEKWKSAMNAGVTNATTQRAARSVMVTAQSDMRKVVSIFRPSNLPALREKITLPDSLPEFLEAWKELKGKLPRKEWAPPDDKTMEALLQSWLTLDREAFLAVGLALSFALRRGEIEQARWDWLTVQHGYHVLTANADVKNGTGKIWVKALEPFYTAMIRRAEAQNWTTGETILTPGLADGTFRAVSAWMEAHGWAETKKAHGLRAYAGSLVAKCFDMLEARDFCRHSSITVTQQHYSHFLTQWKHLSPDALRPLGQRVEWSRAQAAQWQPKIVGGNA